MIESFLLHMHSSNRIGGLLFGLSRSTCVAIMTLTIASAIMRLYLSTP